VFLFSYSFLEVPFLHLPYGWSFFSLLEKIVSSGHLVVAPTPFFFLAPPIFWHPFLFSCDRVLRSGNTGLFRRTSNGFPLRLPLNIFFFRFERESGSPRTHDSDEPFRAEVAKLLCQSFPLPGSLDSSPILPQLEKSVGTWFSPLQFSFGGSGLSFTGSAIFD